MNLRRKRMILMRDVWYGYNRTASGNPVTLDAAKRLRQLTIYGNAVQDGTPTPDTPVDIQLCGDATGNLCPVSKGSTSNFSLETTVEEGETYTFSFVAVSAEGHSHVGANLKIGQTNASPAQIPNIICDFGDRYVSSFTAIKSGDLFFNGYWAQSIEQIQVLKGAYTAETIPDYEPYGYKVSGRVEGVNLYDVNDKYGPWHVAELDDDGWITINYDNTEGTTNSWPPFYTNFRDVIEPNTEYTIVTEIEYISGCALYPATTGVPKPIFNITFFYTQQGTYYMTVTSESDLSDCVLLLRSNYFVGAGKIASAKFRISLLKGSYTADTIPPYEPYQPPQDFAVYLPQQIAKVGDVADTVVLDMEKRTATLVRRTKEIVFDGTENWSTDTNVSGNKQHSLYIASIFSNRVNCFSNRYQVAYANNDHCTYIANTIPVSLHIADNSFTTAAEFKAWLSELYASGEPLKYLFELAAPVTTDITDMQDWDAMPQVKGTVTLTLSAEVPPSGAEAVYYSAERGD